MHTESQKRFKSMKSKKAYRILKLTAQKDVRLNYLSTSLYILL